MAIPTPGIPSNAPILHALRTMYSTWFVIESLSGAVRTCSVLRYTEAGGNAVYGIGSTPTLVTGLTGITVAISQPGQFLEVPTADGRRPMLQEGEREFAFLDLTGGLRPFDVVEVEGAKWEIVGNSEDDKRGRIQNDTEVGSAVGTFRAVQ